MLKIMLQLNPDEAEAITRAVEFADDMSADYFAFAPDHNYNNGDYATDARLLNAALAVKNRVQDAIERGGTAPLIVDTAKVGA